MKVKSGITNNTIFVQKQTNKTKKNGLVCQIFGDEKKIH